MSTSSTTVTVSGPVVLENPRTFGLSPCNLEFDGQLWLDSNHVLTGRFRYYNEEDIVFNEINYCNAWIHMAKATRAVEESSSIVLVPDGPEERNSASETITDERHVYGDIVRLIDTTVDRLRYRPYITVTGVTSNCNNAQGYFDVFTSQYISVYKTEPQFWTFPVRASFISPKYKNKKPMPYNNIVVCVEGLLAGMELDEDTGEPSLFHISISNIGFLGKPFPSKIENSDQASSSTASGSSPGFKFNFGSTSPTSPFKTTYMNEVPPSPSDGLTNKKRRRLGGA